MKIVFNTPEMRAKCLAEARASIPEGTTYDDDDGKPVLITDEILLSVIETQLKEWDENPALILIKPPSDEYGI